MQRNVGNAFARSTSAVYGHFTVSVMGSVRPLFWSIALLALGVTCGLRAQSLPERSAESAPAWSVIGPFANVGGSGVLRRTPPEDPRDTSSTFENLWGGVTRWHPYRGADLLGWVNLTDHAPDVPCVFVARTYVYVPTTRKVRLELGVSGAARFFVNDSLLIGFDDDVFARSGSTVAACTLWQGWNKIHVRIGRDVMPFLSFALRVADESGSILAGATFSSEPQTVTKQYAPFEILTRNTAAIDTTFQRDPRIIRMLRQAVASDSLSAGGLRQAAWAAYGAQSLDTALLLTRSALTVMQEDASMWLLKGLIHNAKGAADSAASAIDRSLEIDPGNIRARVATFNVLHRRNPLDEISRYDVDSIAAAALREPLTDSLAVETILLDMQQALIFGSTSLQRVSTVIRVHSMDSLAQLPLPKRFDESTEGRQKLMILSSNGDQRTIDLRRNDASLEGVAGGDVIIYSAEKWHRDSMFTRHGHMNMSLSPVSHTRLARLSMMVPLTDNYQFKIHNFDPVQTDVETPSGMLFTWTARDVRPVVQEMFMPPLIDYVPHVELSTFPGWNIVVRQMKDAFSRRLQSCDQVRLLVDSLLPPDRKWKKDVVATTIARWVIRSITQQPSSSLAFTPYRACDVLALRSGTTADRVMLASTMMAERGVEAIPTLIKSESNLTYNEPTVSMPFDHVVLVLPGDSSAQMIDLSFRPVPYGVVPASVENTFALPVSDRMRDPVRLHKRFITPRSFVVTTQMQIDTVGWITSKTSLHARDFDSSAIMRMAQSFAPSGVPMPDAQMIVDSTWISPTKNEPASPTCNILMRSRTMADSTQDTIVIRPRWMTMPSYPMMPIDQAQRVHPLVLQPSHDSVSSEIVLTAPKGYTFARPLPSASFKLPSITYSITSTVKGQTLRLRRTVVVHSTYVEPADYPAFRDAHRKMLEMDRMLVRMQRPPGKRR